MGKFAGKIFILCFALVSIFKPAKAQDACLQSLNQASAEFDAGRFYSLPSLLNPCLESGFTREQKFRAYYLLAQAYLVLNDPLGAEISYLKLLQIDPEFKPNAKNDPIDLVYLSRKFTARPKFTPHYKVGLNISFPTSIYELSTFSSPQTSTSQILRIGFQLGGGVDWNITDKWSLGGELNFSIKSFATNVTGIAKNDLATFIDKSNWLDVPIYIKYSYDSGRIRPFGYVGIAANLLLSSSASLTLSDVSPSQGNISKIAEGQDIDLAYKRSFLNRSIIFGGGVKYKIGKNFIYADARYMVGLNNITLPDKNYYNQDGSLSTSLTQYQYSSDFFRLDNLFLSFGYVRPLYDPRKIKKISTKGIFKKLFRPKKK